MKNLKYSITFENLDLEKDREEFRTFLLEQKNKFGNNFIFNIKETATDIVWTIQAVDSWCNVMIWKAGTKGATRKTTLQFFPDSISARARGERKNALYR